jgi:hypothetical protein
MKATLSAIGYGALIACACNAALAGPTITTTQIGTGNKAYAEQSLLNQDLSPTAIITQTGNDNDAGDPATQRGGIHQIGVGGSAEIHQLGNANSAGIVQEATSGGPESSPIALIKQTGNGNHAGGSAGESGGIHQIGANARAEIDQLGNANTATIVQGRETLISTAKTEQEGERNTAAISQENVFLTEGLIHQSGADNVANLVQHTTDVSFHGLQTGVGNFLAASQFQTAHGPTNVTQTGAFNSVSLEQDDVFFALETIIEQTGNMNAISSIVQDDSTDAIRQVGTGNTAKTVQKDFGASHIVQQGSNNLAMVNQELGANESQIWQLGNGNSATVKQSNAGPWSVPNTANIKQFGDGYAATIIQTGSDNHAGVYQH